MSRSKLQLVRQIVRIFPLNSHKIRFLKSLKAFFTNKMSKVIVLVLTNIGFKNDMENQTLLRFCLDFIRSPENCQNKQKQNKRTEKES